MAYCAPRGIPLSTFLSWPLSDQDAALSWLRAEARRCSGCGTDPEDWADGDAWHAETRLCPGCAKREAAQAEENKKDRKGHLVRLARGPSHECPSCSKKI